MERFLLLPHLSLDRVDVLAHCCAGNVEVGDLVLNGMVDQLLLDLDLARIDNLPQRFLLLSLQY